MECILGMSRDCFGINVLGFSGRGLQNKKERKKPRQTNSYYLTSSSTLHVICQKTFGCKLTETQLKLAQQKMEILAHGNKKDGRGLSVSPSLGFGFPPWLLHSQAACPCVVTELASNNSRRVSYSLIALCLTSWNSRPFLLTALTMT